jgi:uncharacterized protein
MLKVLSIVAVYIQSIGRRQKTSQTVNFLQKVPTIACVSIEALQASGIKGIILDLDNTIVSEDDRYLSPHAETWIQQAKTKGLAFFILSNGKRKHRVVYWSQRLDIPAISPAKKPFPFSFRKALKRMQLRSNQAIVIGDSLHTDVMGAFFSGCTCIQVATLPHPPRWWEKIIGRWVQRPYPRDRELWELD